MPRLRKTQKEVVADQVHATVKKYQVLKHRNEQDMAASLGLCRQTYRTKMKDPNLLTVGELLSIKRQLEIPMHELMEALEH